MTSPLPSDAELVAELRAMRAAGKEFVPANHPYAKIDAILSKLSEASGGGECSSRDHAQGIGSALEDAPLGQTLWAVYGPGCFPTVFACQLNDHFTFGRILWGYSLHEGEPGFRTLGLRAEELIVERDLRLFSTREEAFAHIASLFPSSATGSEAQAEHRDELESRLTALQADLDKAKAGLENIADLGRIFGAKDAYAVFARDTLSSLGRA